MPEDKKNPKNIEVVDLKKHNEKISPGFGEEYELSAAPETVKNKPEQIEAGVEKLKAGFEQEGAGAPELRPGSIIRTGQARQKQKEQEKEIEKVLETGLEDQFLKMDPEKRREFASKGEETAKTINDLFDKGKASAKRIIELIKKWLSLIPGVNKFFLEQEAKIKADEIIKKRNQQVK